MNILKPGYKNKLYYVVYNGPPNTISEEYRRQVTSGNEREIIDAIKAGCHLYDSIENPSEAITCAAIRSDNLFIKKIENPSKNIIMAMISKSSYLYKEYNPNDTFFTNQEKIELITDNVDVIVFIKNPTDVMMDLAVAIDPSKLLIVKQTLIRIALALELFIQKKRGHICLDIWCPLKNYNWIDQINYSDYYNNFDNPEYKRIFGLIIDRLDILGKAPKLHSKYLTDTQLVALVKSDRDGLKKIIDECPERLNKPLYSIGFSLRSSTIQYIPHQFQDETMIDKILSSRCDTRNYGRYLKQSEKVIEKMREVCALDELPKEYQTREICLKYLKAQGSWIKEVRDDLIDEEMLEIVYNSYSGLKELPEKYRNRRFCHKLIVNRIEDLQYVPDDLIDNDLLYIIFKSTPNLSRKSRLDFIVNFKEDKIVTIIKCWPGLFNKLNDYQKTDRIIKEMLYINGYALEYLSKEQQEINNGEYVKLALSVQPKAVKYIK